MEKLIWTIWLQGEVRAPALVRACTARWRQMNPGWIVRLLDWESLKEFVDPEVYDRIGALKLPPQKTANLFRLYLINRHGGVWVDADAWCARPLDDWLPRLMSGGFLAFRFPADDWLGRHRHNPRRFWAPSGDRIMANWFLAGRPGNAITEQFLVAHEALLRAAPKNRTLMARVWLRLVSPLMRRNAYISAQFSRPTVLRAIGYFPYFVFHYHFARLTLTSEGFLSAWRRVPNLPIGEAIRYGRSLLEPADAAFRQSASGGTETPILKLHWNMVEGQPSAGSRYEMLLSMAGTRHTDAA